MKKTLIVIAGLLAVTGLTGCSTIVYERNNKDGTVDRVKVNRAWWATENYEAELTTNGAKLKATKSNSNGSPINEMTELLKAIPVK